MRLNEASHCVGCGANWRRCQCHVPLVPAGLAVAPAPRVAFECGHLAFLLPEEYGDGSAWCQRCGEFLCYEASPEART